MTRSKRVEFAGDTQKRLRSWPETARRKAGFEIRRLQSGEQPTDFKPVPSIGPGVEELRVWDDSNRTYRVIYMARLADAVHVLHAFQKTTQQMEKKDHELAKRRYAALVKGAKK